MSDAVAGLTSEASFQRWNDVTIRFSDQDSMGHINNVSYAAYIEVARTHLLHDLQARFPRPGLQFTLAHISIDYLHEAFYPGTVRVGGRPIRVGTKSLTSGYGVFLGSLCLATAHCVNVCLDAAKRQSQPIPDDMRRFIENEIARGQG